MDLVLRIVLFIIALYFLFGFASGGIRIIINYRKGEHPFGWHSTIFVLLYYTVAWGWLYHIVRKQRRQRKQEEREERKEREEEYGNG